MLDIIDHYGDKQDDFADYAAEGQWNDPDMVGTNPMAAFDFFYL